MTPSAIGSVPQKPHSACNSVCHQACNLQRKLSLSGDPVFLAAWHCQQSTWKHGGTALKTNAFSITCNLYIFTFQIKNMHAHVLAFFLKTIQWKYLNQKCMHWLMYMCACMCVCQSLIYFFLCAIEFHCGLKTIKNTSVCYVVGLSYIFLHHRLIMWKELSYFRSSLFLV